MLKEALKKKIPLITLYVDTKSLHNAAMTTNVIAEKCFMIDMAILREMIER